MRYLWVLLPVFILASCSTTYHLADVTESSVELSAAQDTSPSSIESIITPYRKQMGSEMESVIGTASETLVKKRPKSSLGFWFADVIRIKSAQYIGQPVDIGIMNQGGIRLPYLEAGPIKKQHMYELMPFDNMLVVLQLDGKMVLTLFEHMAAMGGWPVSAGVSYRIKDDQLQQVTLKGKPIEPMQTYLVALSDYNANGGDNCSFLKGQPRLETGRFMRDGLIEFVETQTAKGNAIHYKGEQRIFWEDN